MMTFIPARIRAVGWIAFIAACCLLLGGCDDKKKIDNASRIALAASGTISTATDGMGHDVASLRTELLAEPLSSERMGGFVDSIDRWRSVIIAANKNIAAAGITIQESLPGIENKGGFFATIKRWLVYAAIAIGCVLFLKLVDVLGLKPVFNKLTEYFPSLIDWFASSLKREAEADVKALDPDDDMSLREAVAAKRHANPAYNTAFERAKQRQEQRKAKRLLEQAKEAP